jgi:predicted MFS family arabinose efflux permease
VSTSTARRPVASETRLITFLGVACAVGVSSIYYNQPLLLEMRETFLTTPAHIGLVAMATQIGYAAGLLFFVPLGDVRERRLLIMRLFGGVSLALLLVASAPTLQLLIIASALVGAMASVTHVVLPLASEMAPHGDQGSAIGTVMTGLLLGVLLARTFAGWISKISGWRSVFLLAAVINLAFVPIFRAVMPVLPPKERLNYGKVMASLWTLFRNQPLLRESCIIGAFAFASFSCFWTTFVFLLQSHYNLGSGAAGTFGLVGAAGAFVAPFAGRKCDVLGSRYGLTVGIATLTASLMILWGGEALSMPRPAHVAVLILGVVMLDVGAEITQIANQTRIFGLVPSGRSRINTVYMTIYFSGGALGSWVSTKVWTRWQSNGVFFLALSFIVLAAISHATGLKAKVRSNECMERVDEPYDEPEIRAFSPKSDKPKQPG